jgi:BirA family biotin operon repressor/biotin-[acetyl-CoA-carboxylase] ligase
MAIGDPIIAFDSLESTNKTAAELLGLSKVQHGAVIMAREQTSGRGQRGRSWTSVAGDDLMISIVLRPDRLRADVQFELSKIAALAVSEVVGALVGGAVRIKWPNDILVGRNKICGILIKNELIGELVMTSILGIGINVNSTEYPEDLVATSLRNETGRTMDLQIVLADLCRSLDNWYSRWEGGGDLSMAYAERLWMRGRWAQFLLDDHPTLARPVDVDRHGRLIIEQEGGEVAAYGLDRLRFAPR